MKLAVVNYIRRLKGEGEFYRFLALKKAAEKNNLPMAFFLFTDDNFEEIEELKGKDIVIKKTSVSTKSVFKHYAVSRDMVQLMNKNGYKVVILRYSPLSLWYYLNFKKKDFYLITEHHAKEIDEFMAKRNFKSLFAEASAQRLCSRLVDGVIGLTEEIRNYEVDRFGLSRQRTVCISNGVFVDEIPLTKYKAFDGHNLNMIFIASTYNRWHGLDRVLNALCRYKEGIKVKLHIVGDINENHIKKDVNGDYSKVELHGIRRGRELDELFLNMNLAIGTLGLHRKNMKEACALKIREYTARGIPFILAYKDTDLDASLPFVRQFAADDTPIDMKGVVRFLEKISRDFDKDRLSSDMRGYARERMDWAVKINKYLEFSQQFLG